MSAGDPTPELGAEQAEGRGRVCLVALVDQPLDVAGVLAAVAGDDVGGAVLFVGSVRDHDHGHPDVRGLDYTAHPAAEQRLREVAQAVAQRHDVRVAAVHRTGPLRVGDLAVVVASAAAHRPAAFAATRELIDELKAQVPIWKHQRFGDGTEEWVGTP